MALQFVGADTSRSVLGSADRATPHRTCNSPRKVRRPDSAVYRLRRLWADMAISLSVSGKSKIWVSAKGEKETFFNQDPLISSKSVQVSTADSVRKTFRRSAMPSRMRARVFALSLAGSSFGRKKQRCKISRLGFHSDSRTMRAAK